MVPEIGVVGAIVGTSDQGGVVRVHSQAWCNFRVQFHLPATIALAYDHIGNDVFRFGVGNDRAGFGVQALDQADDLQQVFFPQPAAAHQLGIVPVTQ